jgi:hypothetical protein
MTNEHDYSEHVTYLDTWKRALAAILGWDDDRVVRWASQYAEGLKGEDPWFYRETSIFYIAPLLITERLRKRLKLKQLSKLERDLQMAIEFGATTMPADLALLKDTLPFFEWLPKFEEFRKSAVEKALWFSEGCADVFDWESAKKRVQAVLEQYGEVLPRLADGDIA